ncbi:MAG: S24 family peptidase [Pseudomonadota bacterium]
MPSFDEVFARIKLATSTRTQVELAEVLEIRQSSISDAKRRNSVPADWYMKLFEKFGLNPDWLKKGTGPTYLRTDQGYEPTDAPIGSIMEDPSHFSDPDSKSSVVTVYSMSCGSGEVNAPYPLPAIAKLAVPLSYAGQGIQVVRLDASSMEPMISKGAYIGIDVSQKHIVSGEMYGVYIPFEGIALKHVFLDAENSRFVLRSINPNHPEQYLPLEQHASRIFGRVVWVLQRV